MILVHLSRDWSKEEVVPPLDEEDQMLVCMMEGQVLRAQHLEELVLQVMRHHFLQSMVVMLALPAIKHQHKEQCQRNLFFLYFLKELIKR